MHDACSLLTTPTTVIDSVTLDLVSDREPDAWSRVEASAENIVDDGIDELFQSLRIPSVSDDPAALRESAAHIVSVLERDGWLTEIAVFDNNPIVMAQIGSSVSNSADLIFYGHHDVQPVDPLSAWSSPPFEPVIRDGRIYCRGAADNKGQFFCHIFAVRALRRALGAVPIRIALVLDGQEEAGSRELPAFVESRRARLEGARLCLTADGPTRQEKRPEVVFGVRGQLRVRLRIRTAATDLHSGNWGNLVPSAGWRLAQVLVQLKGNDGRVTVPGFYDGVVAPTQLERRSMRDMAFDLDEAARSVGAVSLDGPADADPLERLMFMPTFTVTGIQCGHSEKATIPTEAVAHIDVRLVAAQDPAAMFALLQAHLTKIAPDALLEFAGGYSPSRTPMETPIATAVIDAVRTGFRAEPLLVPCSGGTLPDSVFALKLRVPVLDVPYAGRDQRNHAPNENMRLDHVRAGSRTSAALIMQLTGR